MSGDRAEPSFRRAWPDYLPAAQHAGAGAMKLRLFDRAGPVGEDASAAIRREERAGLAYMFWGRLAVLGLIAIWVLATLPFSRSGLYLAAIAAFALLGAIPYWLSRRSANGWAITAGFLLL